MASDEEQGLLLAVLRHQADAVRDGVARRARCATGWPSIRTRPESKRIGAEDGARDLGAARADQAGDAEDLALADLEGHVVELDGARHRVLLRRREMPSTASATSPRGKRRIARGQQAELAAHHQPDDAVDRRYPRPRRSPTWRPSRSTV